MANEVSRHRSTEVGHVVGRPGTKTIVVEVTRRVQHPLYKRYLNRRKKFYAHDERNECRVGDRVRIVESRPLSRLKRWRLKEILSRAAVLPALPEAPGTEIGPEPRPSGSGPSAAQGDVR